MNIKQSQRPSDIEKQGGDYITQTFCAEYGIDTHQYEKELEELKLNKKNNEMFVDEHFPPTRESLCQNWNEISDPKTKSVWEEIVWLRPSQFMKGQINVFENIEPNDIIQGLLGDCYFLCSLSSLAERPHLIKRLFETKSYQQNGLYSIWLNINGEWKNFLIDDFIPCRNNKPAFSRAQGNELWVLLLEKVYAKAYGSYFRIEGGNPAVALRDLTGAPYINFDNKDPSAMFQFLYDHDKNGKGDILTCYTKSTEIREEQTKLGLYSGHAYSILDVKQISDKSNQQIQLLQIRNPWGKGEWKGNWSDSSPLWNQFTKQQVNFTEQEDGMFFMSIQDFVQYFEGVGVSQVVDTNLYNSIAFKSVGNQNQSIIKLTLPQNSKSLSISLNQRDTRFFPEGTYQYSLLSLIFVKRVQEEIYWINGCFDYERDQYLNCQDLEAGEYYMLIEAKWSQDFNHNLVLSSYSDVETKLSFVEKGLEFEQMTQQALKSFCLQSKSLQEGAEKQKIKITELNGNQICRMNGNEFGMLFFYFSNNSWNTTLIQTMNFTKLIGYQLPLYYNNKENIQVILPPQREQILVFKFNAIKDFKTEYSFKASLKMENKDQCNEVPINQKVFLQPISTFNQVKEIENIEAKDRKIGETNFKLREDPNSKESAVTVYPCEVSIINFLTSMIAPFSKNYQFYKQKLIMFSVKDWPLYLFRLTMIYSILLMFISFDNCNFLDIVLVSTCFILFTSQVATRKRLRKLLFGFMASTIASIVWQLRFPTKWNSVDSQYNQVSKKWRYLIPLLQIGVVIIKVNDSPLPFLLIILFFKAYLTLIYWKIFVCYDQLIQEVYAKFTNTKKEILGK